MLGLLAGMAMSGLAQTNQPALQENDSDHFVNNVRNVPDDTAWKLEKISPDYDWTRHFRMGGLVGFNIKGDFGMSGNLSLSHAPGVYDDGYVHLDSRNNPEETSYFGYNDASQYNSTTHTLTMQSATSFLSSGGGESGNSDSGASLGFDLAYGDSYWYWEHAKLGWEFGFGLLPVHIESSQTVSGTVTRTAYQFDATSEDGSYSYIFPIPGYQGGYENDPGSQMVNINPNPTVGGNSTTPATDVSTESLDAMLYTIRLGPTLYWDLTQRIGVYAGVGPAIGFVSGNLDSKDTITITDDNSTIHSHAKSGGTDFIYGGYINATFVYHAVEGGDFYLGAQFMPMSEATFSGGGRSGSLDFGGQLYITAGINWPF